MIITIKVQDMALFKDNVMQALRAIRNLGGMTLRKSRDICLGIKMGEQFSFKSDQNAEFLRQLKEAGVQVVRAEETTEG